MQSVVTQSPLANTPILRIVVPFIGGIIASQFCIDIYMPMAILTMGIILYVSLRSVPHTPAWAMRTRQWWIVAIALVSLSLGWINTILLAPPELNTKDLDGAIAQARVNDINYRDNSMEIHATLTSACDNNKQLIGQQYDILLSTRGCIYTMQPGDMISFECELDTIKGLRNPDCFDYASHMLNQGIRYSEHIPVDKIVTYDHDPTLITQCNKYRRQLQQEIFSTELSAKAQSFVVAILLGNSRFIAPETRSIFSSAGISHVLALSGLHVSIILLAVWFFFFPLDYFKLRKLRLVLTIILMVFYAIFTGLSPSVVRATVMMIMVVIGLMVYRKSITLNTLATAALIILVMSPSALFSVGFQLSFITVTAFLLVFNKHTTASESRKKQNKALSYLKNLLASSIVAMLSTIVLTAWYFGTMSFTSAISNIFVLPLFPIMIACSIIFILLCANGIQLDLLNFTIDSLYSYIEWIAQLTGKIIPGSIDSIYINGTEVLIYYITLILLFIWYYKKKFIWLNFAVLAMVTMIVHNAYLKATAQHHGIIVLNNYSQTQILAYNGNEGYLWIPDGTTDAESFKHYNNRFLAHHSIDTLELIVDKQHAIINGKKIVCITNGKWNEITPPASKIKTDLLIITKLYSGTIEQISKIYDAEHIILSGDIYKGNLRAFENECKQLGIRYYSVSHNGAWIEPNK